ncbi:unnamed protein product [Orchesella dallaii]|uniref:Suppressor of cytokine signaling 7 n=1 Tax=Orchesella dallaii TaxID=48710 RepID=A0ABP1Q467_9HEXA
MPPPHRSAHNGYRLSQKDLVQPPEDLSRRTPSSSRNTKTKDDSNPVMRSASFNLEYGGPRRTNLSRVRSHVSSTSHTNAPLQLRYSSHVSTKTHQNNQSIIIGNENSNDGSGDVYNDPVPFQSDIYSLPVDSLISGNASKNASCKNGISQQHNSNQRLKLESESSILAPPPRKNNLNRRKSQDCSDQGIIQSSQSSNSQIHKPQPEERNTCRPPQRWSSLSVQPTSASVITKEEIASALSSAASSAFASVTTSIKPTVELNLPPPYTQPPPPVTSLLYHKNATAQKNGLVSDAPQNNGNSNAGIAPSSLNTSDQANNCKNGSLNFPKKPRSRSVDPSGGTDYRNDSEPKPSLKRPVGSTLSNAEKVLSINFDNPLPPEPVLAGSNSEAHNHHQHGSFKESPDRRNPLGLSFLNLFRRNKNGHGHGKQTQVKTESNNGGVSEEISFPTSNNNLDNTGTINNNNKEDTSYYFRELPPPPPGHSDSSSDEQATPSPVECRDFAASIERVKDCGWYWGPLSSEAAEDLLRNEPDGSFIVRDSSDARYIFSLTFKLHGLVRHVRIEHDQGNFSFGPLTRFKAATIVDFVEKAVAHSRSGRYLFFLHRRPVLGPMQVQLLHPYSRFMHPRSLKHMCRFVILKYVRKDLIHTLPLPKPLQDYLNTPHYYFEPPDGNTKKSSSQNNIT